MKLTTLYLSDSGCVGGDGFTMLAVLEEGPMDSVFAGLLDTCRPSKYAVINPNSRAHFYFKC